MSRPTFLVMRDYHRIVMLTSWAILGDLAIINNRYLRYSKTFNRFYIQIHLMLFSIVSIIMTVSIGSMVYTWPILNKLQEDKRLIEFRLHIGIGVAHYVLLLVNIVMGLKQQNRLNGQSNKSKNRIWHSYNGWLLYFIAKVNYIIGNMTNLARKEIEYDVLYLFIV